MLRIFLILLALASAVMGQESAPASDFLVRAWQNEEGLPGNVVRSLGQTPDGVLWVATTEGLARFDGLEFTNLTSNVDYKEPPLDSFRIFTPEDGSVWVANSSGGLLKVTNGALERIVDDMAEQYKLITQLITHDGNPYFIREDNRVWTIEGHGLVLVTTVPPGLAAAIEADRRLMALRGRANSRESPSRLIDRNGGNWHVQTGSLRYAPADDSPTSPPVPDFGGRLVVNDMLEDREGNLWLASPVQGLIRVRHRQVKPLTAVDGIYNEAVQTAIRDRGGSWWLAPRNGGVDRIRDGMKTHYDIISSGIMRTVTCIYEDSSGQLWFTTRDASVFKWNGESFEVAFGRNAAVSKINAITEDSVGRLWFGGRRGGRRGCLWRWDGTTLEDFSNDPMLAGATISTLAAGQDGNILAGTIDGRVLNSDGKSFGLLGKPEDLGGRVVSAILPLHPGEIWVSTIGQGLFLWQDARWQRFGREDGIPDDRLTALTLVGEDSFWMGSFGGILGASRAELLSHITNKEFTPRWLRLDRSDGMITRECVGGSQPGVFRDHGDGLWFPTTAGLAGVKPHQIATTPPPTLQLRQAEINGVPYSVESGSLAAGPGRVSIGFHFTGLSLSAPEKVSYRVQLIGLDEHPRLIGTRREVDYQAVPPGHYTFEVSAMNGEGISSLHPAVLAIEIRPHLWETTWFKALVAISGLLLALSIGWLVARRRLKGKIQDLRLNGMLEAERSRIASDLHDDLGASLTELSILSEIATEDPDDVSLRTSMKELSIKAKRVVGTLDEIVWATNPTEDSLRSLIEYLPEFAREFLKAVNIPLRTNIEHQFPDLSIGPGRRHNVLLATREAINNAVKYAQPRSIFLGISIQDDQLVIQVQDDGKGFDIDHAPSGHGLDNMRNRMTDCGGGCSIESVRDRGTTVTLTLPLTS